MKKETVGIFCSSQYTSINKLPQAVNIFTSRLSQKGYRVIFGGGQKGLMGEVYKGAIRSNPRYLVGIPLFSFLGELKTKKHFDKLYLAKTLGKRKDLFVKYSDYFVVLPGAVGTIDEFFHCAVLSAYGEMDKPIIIVNINGFWNDLIKLILHPVHHHLLRKENLKNIYVVDRLKEVIPCIKHLSKKDRLINRFNYDQL